VLDRNGHVVAANRLNWRALLVAEQTTDVAATLETFHRIVPLADGDRARIERDVRRRRRFIPVIVREFLSWEEMARIEVNAPDLPGIVIDVGTTRVYPKASSSRTSSATSRPRPSATWTAIRCSSFPASASAAPGSSATTTRSCAAAPARCSWR
jgi:cell division protein FtsI/penicillin-binding protein 2